VLTAAERVDRVLCRIVEEDLIAYGMFAQAELSEGNPAEFIVVPQWPEIYEGTSGNKA
jgi:hypothetical protein